VKERKRRVGERWREEREKINFEEEEEEEER
jgi:hypothetical protein